MESKNISISIIIPVYNVEKYLKECLDSVLNQTFQDFEIICIDDGSTDKSLEILEEYKNKDSRFKILRQNHEGAGSARNKGIEEARGKYIQFFDSDDYFEPTMLEELYTHAEKFDADVTICSSRKVDENGEVIETESPNFPINKDLVPFEKIFNRNHFKETIFNLFTCVIWNRLVKREFLISNNIKFPPLKIFEDIAFCSSTIICAERIVCFNRELLNYRCNRAGSLVSTRTKFAIESIKSCLYLKEFLIKNNLFDEFEKAYTTLFVNTARAEMSYCSKNELKEFIEQFKDLLPDDWKYYQNMLEYNYITPEYLNKIIGSKKTMFWGASLFLKKVLEQETKANPNIIGIIDRNPKYKGETFGNYKIYSPEDLNKLKPQNVVLTILSNNEIIYKQLKDEFEEKYPNIELLPNIFQ